ncbi:MAG: AtpZ/AtpI family protein [Thermodesulfobacteriota bacterium]
MSSQRREAMRLVTRVSAGTLELGLSVAVGAGIGYVLDTQVFGGRTTPWLTLFWLLCGVIAGFRSLLRVMRELQREGEQEGNGNPPR